MATQIKGELKIIQYSATRWNAKSASSETSVDWNLNRGRIREILEHLAWGRKLQTTFANTAGAAISKAAKEGKLRHAIRLKFQAIDFWELCLACFCVELNGTQDGKRWLLFVEQITNELATDAPAVPGVGRGTRMEPGAASRLK